MSASTHGTPASGYGTDLLRLICFEHIYGYTFPCTHQQGATRMTSTHPAGGATCWPNDVDADRHTIYRWCCIPPGPWVQGILSQPRESTGVTCALSGLGIRLVGLAGVAKRFESQTCQLGMQQYLWHIDNMIAATEYTSEETVSNHAGFNFCI